MKIVQSGARHNIFNDDLKVYDNLEVGTYAIRFDPKSGYSLERISNYQPTKDKIYGRTNERIEKVMKKFKAKDGNNLGVLLSGKKGMGKTLLAQELSARAREEGLPVILVNQSTPSLVSFLDSIEQKVLVLFDEFEKVFDKVDGDTSQEDLLTLFDGTSNSQKLFVVTINDRYKTSEFLFNRTGRFYYHFKMANLDLDQICEYAEDNLIDKKNLSIVKELGKVVKLNYDTLESIIEELNEGETILAIAEDLNIDMESKDSIYTIETTLDNGEVIKSRRELNLMAEKICFNAEEGAYDFVVEVLPSGLGETKGGFSVRGEHAKIVSIYSMPEEERDAKVTKVIIKEDKNYNPLINGYLGGKL